MRAQQDRGSASVSRRVALVTALIAVMLIGCNQDRTSPGVDADAGSDADKTTCVADSLSALRILPGAASCATSGWSCRIKCQFGSGPSCLGLAYAAQRDSQELDESESLFKRACELGMANGCTNYAAAIWTGGSAVEQLGCARRIFKKACSAKERFACGMVGRVMIESTTPPLYTEGRRYLQTACDAVGGFSCRVLAMHLESGSLGEYRPALIPELLSQACAGGDPDACGAPVTASETFQ